jgi:hypothetical protein
VAQIGLASQFDIDRKSRSILVFKLAISLARQSPQARKSVPTWDEFFAVHPVRSTSLQRREEWQELVINIANLFIKKMAIPMDLDSRRLKSQPLSSPCLKPGASRSFFGDRFAQGCQGNHTHFVPPGICPSRRLESPTTCS